MLRVVKRLPLRRCIHTNPESSSTRVFTRRAPSASALVLGASFTFVVAWTLGSDSRRIALDAQPLSASRTRPTSASEILAPDASSLPITSAASSDASPTPPVEVQNEAEAPGGAFNPVTGEINWDCPCLGGMAHGPCGLEFREAFSCFVHSEKEPKGVDCVEKFKAMQNCFRQHPDVYGDEIMDDDDDMDLDSPAQAQSTDDVQSANLDDMAQEHVQHPSSPISA